MYSLPDPMPSPRGTLRLTDWGVIRAIGEDARGFLGSELLPRVLEREPSLTASCLVQGKFRALAERRAGEERGPRAVHRLACPQDRALLLPAVLRR